MSGLYVHIPFCRRVCGYCDFYKIVCRQPPPGYIDALIAEMGYRRNFLTGEPLRTIYFGGGTPSLYPAAELGRVLAAARELWDCGRVEEITVEANPDDVVPDYVLRLLDAGVNRLSIGVQSFVDDHLSFMNRRHDAQQAENSIRVARAAGVGNISADLIYGIPGMSEQQWESNIDHMVELGVNHISAYHLTIEPGTAFGARAAEGKLRAVDEDQSQDQYMMLHRKLTEAGYEHYEISNFALPGFRSRHNSSYWSGKKYLGIGPSAHSYDGGHQRSVVVSSVEEYLRGAGKGHIYEWEELSERDLYNELVMVSLRTANGVDKQHLRARAGERYAVLFEASAQRFVREGVLVDDGRTVRIPAEHFLASDSIIADLFITQGE